MKYELHNINLCCGGNEGCPYLNKMGLNMDEGAVFLDIFGNVWENHIKMIFKITTNVHKALAEMPLEKKMIFHDLP